MRFIRMLKKETIDFKYFSKFKKRYLIFAVLFISTTIVAKNKKPDELKFVRQGVARMIFDENQSIALAKLQPDKTIGLEAMHPITNYRDIHANVSLEEDKLIIQSQQETQTGIWFGGFNPFATYTIHLESCSGEGEIGFEFSDADKQQQFFIQLAFKETILTGVKIRVVKNEKVIADEPVSVNLTTPEKMEIPFLDQGRLWYTMSIRGRALPHHIQGVFSMNPSVFDIKLEGIILFDRKDGILRNEIASHIFYDRKDNMWHGLTTGFSAYANPEKEKKQLLAVESKNDPRFGFSIMNAVPFGMVGDFEDPHVIYDSDAKKWRMLTCVNQDGYKAIILESDYWNRDYKQIAGPVDHNSTGTSIHKIGDKRYCFSGSNERKIFIYTYPDLKEAGTLKMDLPPWSETSGTRVWPNVVQLPEG